MAQRAKTLEEYLSEDYNRDVEDIRAIESTLAAIASMYVATFDRRKGSWPYQISAGANIVRGERSHGTSAMILSALGKTIGQCTLRSNRKPERVPDLPKELPAIFKKGLKTLFGQLQSDKKSISRTFGNNDPLTISHISDLLRALRASQNETLAEAALKHIPTAVRRIKNLVCKDPSDVNSFTAALLEEKGVKWSAQNAFLALRVIRARADLESVSRITAPRFKAFFEAHVHQQLSFSSIPDSRFDPAELAFCLEGLSICGEEAVDPLLFGRVLSVLRANQETSAYWRPNRPFADRKTGEIMLPLSVEGANSLLRATEMLDKYKLHNTFAGEAVPMFRRFWQWLRARQVQFVALKTPCTGWHSEHINDPQVIHLWDTSQVVEFLLSFRAMLQTHIARETLVLSGVKIEEAETATWSDRADTYEPVSTNTEITSGRVFNHVNIDFIRPWKLFGDRNYSMLLYGPPGTGKTTFAESVADVLDFRLITITVSDFLGAGGALVEARAKAIFEMLKAQTDCVILFDEIDAFLLDRDSKHYRKQDTLFQFLTPGMLTKINDLRAKKRAIFIIATNYENRIDPAIKRPGRIDRQYLLLPPDLNKRISILKDASASKSRGVLKRMAKASVYLSYKDINSAVRQGGTPAQIIKRLEASPRSSDYATYLKRLKSETTFPMPEFVAAAEMAKEADRLDDVKAALYALDEDDKKLWAEALQEFPAFKTRLTKMRLT